MSYEGDAMMNKKVGLTVLLWGFVTGLLVLMPSVPVASPNAPGLQVYPVLPGGYSTGLGPVIYANLAPSNLSELGYLEHVFQLDSAASGILFTLTAEPISESVNFSTLPLTDLDIWAPNLDLDTDILKWVDLPENDLRWILVGNQTPEQTASRSYTKDFPSQTFCPSLGGEQILKIRTDSG
jgi:hypothetical protein